MSDFNAFLAAPKPKLPFLWPASLNLSHLNPIPHKYRPSRRLRARQNARLATTTTSDDVTALKTSFDVRQTIRALRRRQWRLLDAQYLVLLGFIIFSLVITPSAPLTKTGAMVVLAWLLLMPITQQFFLPSLPIWVYLLYFFSSRYIPTEYRPHIWVKVLPALENVLYGANLSNILSAHTYAILDVLAWFPYGIGHFALPAVCSAVMFLFAAPGSTPAFARAFGWMSVIGVLIQILLPCTPPWYERAHPDLAPAEYGMPGSPAGLARIDTLFGVDMYTTSFTTAPVPFGAFPSLHAADVVLEALFMQRAFPRLRPLFIAYAGWVWWATMYLNHHYAVDLVGGGLMAAVTYYIARTSGCLPRRQPGKSHRWEYEYVDFGDEPPAAAKWGGDDDLEGGRYGYGLGLLGDRRASDDWGSLSSSFESARSSGGESESPSASSPGSLSPTAPGDQFRAHHVLGMTPQGDIWDGERLGRESELTDVVVLR